MIDQYSQLFACLNEKKVEYLLIGGVLAIAYGIPRMTKDVDLFLRPDLDNARRCLDALQALGLGTAHLTTAEDLCATEVTIFKDIMRLDVLTNVKGLDFYEAWLHKVFLELGDIHIPALCLDDLVKSKKAAGRTTDLEDIKILEQLKKKP